MSQITAINNKTGGNVTFAAVAVDGSPINLVVPKGNNVYKVPVQLPTDVQIKLGADGGTGTFLMHDWDYHHNGNNSSRVSMTGGTKPYEYVKVTDATTLVVTSANPYSSSSTAQMIFFFCFMAVLVLVIVWFIASLWYTGRPKT